MQKIVVLFIVLLLIFSCGIQYSLKKTFYGKPVSSIEHQFGKPVKIEGTNGDTTYIFVKIKNLQSTEINQGRFASDPIITPKVIKTERFYFSVKNGIIYKARLKEEYSR